MNRKQTIVATQIEKNALHLLVDEQITDLIPEKHMLVDSDHFSFIYLMENRDKDYTYIVLPKAIWSELKQALKGSLPVFLIHGSEKVELLQFQSELEYLIDNIKGNENYGKEMVELVEKIF